jgi:hypothetical protein
VALKAFSGEVAGRRGGQIEDGDASAGSSERAGVLASQPARATGDDGGVAGEIEELLDDGAA